MGLSTTACGNRQPTASRWMPNTWPPARRRYQLRPADVIKNPKATNCSIHASWDHWPIGLGRNCRSSPAPPLENIDQVLIGFLGDAAGPQHPALVVHLHSPVAEPDLVAAWGSPAEEMAGEQKFYHKDKVAYYAKGRRRADRRRGP